MAGQDRHPGAPHLRGVHPIAPDFGQRFHNSHHLGPGLQQLIADDEAHVASTDHQHPPARQGAVEVDQGLGRSGAHHARQGPAGEGQGVLDGPGSQDDDLGLEKFGTSFPYQAHLFVPILDEQTIGHGGQQGFHAGFFGLGQQVLPDFVAPHSGLMLLGAKKFVNLLEELAAGPLILVDERDLGAGPRRFDGRRQSGRAGPHYGDFCRPGFHRFSSHLPRPIWVSMTMPSWAGVTQVRTLG